MKAARKKVAKKAAKKAAKKPPKKTAKKAAKKARRRRQPRPQEDGRQEASRQDDQPRRRSNGGPITWNFKLLSHHLLDGFGGMGEGMSIQIAPDGRRILWLAHESAPKNFTAVDVSDPRKPKVVVQTDLPQAHMRSNSLETCGNIMAVAYQTQKKGLQPAGMELFDISVPEKPQLDLVLRLLGRRPRAACTSSGSATANTSTCASGAADFMPTHPSDDQFYRCIDVRNPSQAGRARPLAHARHQAGRQRDAAAAPPARQGLPRAQLQRLSAAAGPLLPRLHRRRHVRARHLRQGQPEADLVVDQLAALYRLHAHRGAAVRPRADAGDRRVHREQRQGLAEADLGARRARGDQPGADLDLPAAGPPGLRRQAAGSAPTTSTRTCRCRPAGSPTRSCSAPSSTAACAPTTSPTRTSRRQIGVFVPPAPPMAPTGTIQINDVFVDEREIVYAVDRHIGGLYILEMDF